MSDSAAWSPPTGDDEEPEPAASPWSAITALVLCGLCLLRVLASFAELDALDEFGAFGQPDRTQQLLHIATLATGNVLPLIVALGVVVMQFTLSDRESLSPLERVTLLVLTGVAAAFALLVASALVRQLTDGRPRSRTPLFVNNDRIGLTIVVVTFAALAGGAFAVAQRFATDYDDPDDLDDLDDLVDDGESDLDGPGQSAPG